MDPIALLNSPDAIRNVCILAHVDHGKTALADSLLAANGIVSHRLAGRLRFMDSLPEEQARGITIKSSAVALVFRLISSSSTPKESTSTPKESTSAPERPPQNPKETSPTPERPPQNPKETTDSPSEKYQDYLVNLIDSPGHVDFSFEVSSAARLCDGALVVIDVVEGVCSQTIAVLRQAWSDRLRPILVLNKIDRLAVELKLSPSDAFDRLLRVVEQANAVLGSLYAESAAISHSQSSTLSPRDPSSQDPSNNHDESETQEDGDAQKQSDIHGNSDAEIYFAPEKGNVVFASAIDGWAFRIAQFAALHAARLGISASRLASVLWGNYYLDPTTRRVIGPKGLKGRSLRPLFVQLVLENIWAIYDAAATDSISRISSTPSNQQQGSRLERIAKTLGLKLSARDLAVKDTNRRSAAASSTTVSPAAIVLSRWLPAASAILAAVVQHVPSPKQAQLARMRRMLPSAYTSTANLSKNIDAARLVASVSNCCTDTDAPVVVYISKMFGVPIRLLPRRPDPSSSSGDTASPPVITVEQMRQRRLDIIERSKMIERNLATVSALGDVSGSNVIDVDRLGITEDVDNDDDNGGGGDKQEVLVGFARIYSGTISVGQTVHVLGPKYDPDAPDRDHHVTTVTVDRLFLMMGRDLRDLETVPAGNVFAVMGLDTAVLKTATVSSTVSCPSLCRVMVESTPILRVAIEPTHPSQLPLLITAMTQLDRSDPCVRVLFERSGELVLACAGELHLERCVDDLRRRFAKGVGFSVSVPIVPFRETVSTYPALGSSGYGGGGGGGGSGGSGAITHVTTSTTPHQKEDHQAYPTGTVIATTRNGLCTIRVRALPLPHSVHAFLVQSEHRLQRIDSIRESQRDDCGDGVGDDCDSIRAFLRDLHASVDASITNNEIGSVPVYRGVDFHVLVDRVVAFGPKRCGSNLLACVSDVYRMTLWGGGDGDAVFETSVVSGFQMACSAGPLCAEPMSGLCFVVEDVRVDEIAAADDDEEDGDGDDDDAESEEATMMTKRHDGAKTKTRAALPGQILTTMRDVIHRGFLSWSPRLMHAMYTCDLQSPTESLGRVYAVISRRRGRIVSESLCVGSVDLFHVKCVVPVVDSFGVADELRKRTSGAAASNPLLVFSGFDVIDDVDPLSVSVGYRDGNGHGDDSDDEGGCGVNLAKRTMDLVRSRKGLFVDRKVVEHGEKQKTLKNK